MESNLELRSLTLRPMARTTLASKDREQVVVIQSGSCRVRLAGNHGETRLQRRHDVFAGRASALYLPPDAAAEICAEDVGAALVVASDVVASACPEPYFVLPEAVSVERRGRAAFAREVHDIIGAEQPASRLLVGETFSAGGIWSSYPPHKHDRQTSSESLHDERFMVRVAPATGFAVFVCYATETEKEQARIVRDGEILRVRSGFHSFAVAAEHQLYYFWVLSGDTRRLRWRADSRYDWLSVQS